MTTPSPLQSKRVHFSIISTLMRGFWSLVLIFAVWRIWGKDADKDM